MFGTSKTREHRQDVGSALGLRCVQDVRVFVGSGHPVAVVTGIAHRYPRQFRVSMATAARLARSGVPVHIEERGTHDHRKVG